MGDKGLIHLAKLDLQMAKLALGIPDELSVNMAAYHTQQFVEKWLKYNINLRGVRYSKVHSAAILIREAETSGITIPLFLKESTYALDAWATQSRYNTSLLTTKLEISVYITKCEELLDPMQLSNQFQIKF